MKHKLILLCIVALALTLRLYGINWDQGFHLHPDERMLIMVAGKIKFFSQLDPDFFNYGSLPIYLLAGSGQLLDAFLPTSLDTYDGMLYMGRFLSTVFDVLTLVVIFKLSEILLRKRALSLAACFLYAIAIFPIQNSHFFIVDTLLTFFVTLLAYLLILSLQKPGLRLMVGIGLTLAAAITTKFTAIIFIPLVFLFIGVGSIRTEKRIRFDILSIYFVIVSGVTLASSLLFMPYGFLKHEQFISEVSAQIKMNSDAFVFPYTLQYVATTAYLYHLKNIFMWGLGPFTSLFVGAGIFYGIRGLISQISNHTKTRTKWLHMFRSLLQYKHLNLLLFISFYLFFFLLLGKSAVKFMRYMLPLYPMLAVVGGYGFYELTRNKTQLGKIIASIFLGLSFIGTVMFMSIYRQEHTRVAASKWIFENVPSGATLAVEHWDDRIPLMVGPVEQYIYEELALYEQDGPEKWDIINSQLSRTDYLIIASNRLYRPLPKLTDCTTLPPHRCYPQTAQYYKELFEGSRGFTKLAEFSSYPKFEIGGWKLEIPDDSADESFTVYDHPKIFIFQRNSPAL